MAENRWSLVHTFDSKVYECSSGHYVISTRDFLRQMTLAGGDMDSILCPTCAELRQQRERLEKLVSIVKEYLGAALTLDPAKTIPLLGKIDTRAKAALKELEAE